MPAASHRSGSNPEGQHGGGAHQTSAADGIAMNQRKWIGAYRVALFLLAAVVLGGGADWLGLDVVSSAHAQGTATLTSDQPNYSPGQTVTLYGSGFQPGENVTIVISVNPVTHGPYTTTSVADADGNFVNGTYVDQETDLGVTFTATATGDQGSFAETTFTDSDTLTAVISPTGGGTVTSSTGGISCPGTCTSTSISGGTTVVMTATANSGFAFSKWTIAGSAGTGATTCTNNATTNPCNFITPTGGGNATTFTAVFVATTAAPTMTKSFNPTTIAVGSTSNLTLTVTNPNAATTLTGVAFTDTLTSGVTVNSTFSNTCNGTLTDVANSSSIALSGASLAGAASCTVVVTVNGTSGGSKANSVNATSTNGGTGATANATLTVIAPPTISKSFSPTSVATGVASTMTITITNPAGNPATLTGVAITDNLPTNLVVQTPNSTTGCTGGTYSGGTGATTVSLTGASVAVGTPCVIILTVQSPTVGTYNNTTLNVTSSNGGTGGTASATLTVVNPVPTITTLAPPSATAGSGPLTLTINGTNFLATSTATYNGVAHAVTFMTSAQVQIQLTAADVTTPGLFPVVVTNPAPGGGNSNSVNFEVIGTATQLVFGQQPTNTAAGASITPAVTVKVEDAAGNVVTSNTDPITIAIGNNPGSGTLSGTLIVNAVNGVATFSGLSINKTGTAYTLTAADGALAGATSSSFNITPGTATQLVFTVEPSASATGGTAFGQQPTVSVEDANNNVVTTSTASITLAITSGTGTPGAALSCTTNPKSATAGVDTFAGCAINLAGSGYTLTATSGVLTSTISTPINVSVGVEAKLAFLQQPTNAVAGVAIAPAITVQVEDAGGNVITTSTDSISIAISTNPGGGTLSGTIPVNAVNGVATFSDLSINKTGTGYRLTASDSTTVLTTAVSNTFNITPNTATQLVFTLQTTGGTGGSNFGTQPKVSVEDQFNNVVTTDNTDQVTLAIGTNPGTGTLSCTTNPLTVVAGVANFAGCKIDQAGNGYTLTATSGSLTSATSNPFNITIGAAAKLAFTVQPDGSSTGGVAFPTQPTVTIEDAGGNPTGTGTNSITLTITSGTGTAGATLTCTTNPKAAVAGVDTFAGCAINLAGSNYTLTAAAGGLTSGISAPFNVSVGPEAKLGISVQPSNTVAGNPITPAVVVQVQDAGGNVVTTSTDSISMAISTNPGGGTLSGTVPVNAVNGVATFSNLSINRVGTGYRLTASDSTTALTTAVSNTFNITVGAAAQLAFTTEPSATATPATNFATQPTVTVQDASGNTITTGTGSTASITLVLGGTGGGALTCTANPKAATAGVDTFAACKISLSGSYTLTATSAGLTSAVSTTINVLSAPTIAKAFLPTSIPVGGVSVLTFTITNPAANGTALTGVGVTDTLPSGMQVAATPGATTSGCGTPTFNPAANATTVTFSGGTIAVSGTCTASVNVTGTTGGSKINTTGNVTSTNGGNGTTASATLVVVAPIVLSKQFTPSSISVGGVSTLTLTFGNPGANSVGQTGIAVTDNFPASLQVASPTNFTTTCGFTSAAPNAGDSGLTLSGGTVGVGVGCTASVSVTDSTSGSFTNTTGTVSSNEGGTGTTASATLVVLGPASQLVWGVQPSNTGAANVITPAVTVNVEDAGGNIITTGAGSTASVTMAIGNNAGPGVLGGTLTVNAVSGVATFSTLTINTQGTGYTLTASSAGLTSATSNPFNITPPIATYIQPFTGAHGWTYQQTSCAVATTIFPGSCANSTNVTTVADCQSQPCVDSSVNAGFQTGGSQSGYFHSPIGSYTWQTLGVPANAAVTAVQGGWYDLASTCSTGTTAGIQIFDGGNATEITSPSVAPLVAINADTAVTQHAPGAAATVSSGFSAASTGITLRFNMNDDTSSFLGACTVYGDTFELIISYTPNAGGGGRRGQVVIAWNRQADGSMGRATAYDVELPDGAAGVAPADLKMLPNGISGSGLDPVALGGRGRRITKLEID